MKSICLFCLGLVLSGGYLFAQNDGTYLFENFMESSVVYKDGRKFVVDLNYDLVKRYFVFIDKTDNNQEKEFGEPEKIGAIKIGDRTFMPEGSRGAIEVLQFDPPVYMQIKGKIRPQDKKSAYGTTSSSSAIDSYSSTYGSGGLHMLKTEGFALSGIDKSYQIVVNKKKKSFANEKQFLKIYPKHQDELKQFIEQNKIDFDLAQDMIKLCSYAFEISQ